ncbi:GDP/UDP-N,N'-diacetylbacillosamine 2-epimerase (hydrolyzing) [Aurantimicrobium minutum]|nr:GDP/UDP-N,N'-diacetylbacillosamine 2-epimerase (hydrolyzing) [Aurantimicrobium minutum]
MHEVDKSKNHELLVIATGSHLSAKYGFTVEEILKDGFDVSERIEILLESDSNISIAKSTGLAFIGLSEVFARQTPDLLVLLGDRYEAFAAVSTAFLMGIPVAHIAGGELTEGALDDNLRHAMTKMSDLHFPSTNVYAKRILQLGEPEDRVFTVGATGLDNFAKTPLMSLKKLANELNFNLEDGPLILCTYHPETKQSGQILGISPLLAAFSELKDLRIVFTKANADEGGNNVNNQIADFVSKNSKRSILVSNLGQMRYISMLNFVDLVIGNSSSGITEAPSAGVPTVNIGDRQSGRLRAPSIIDVENSKEAITKGIEEALSSRYKQIASQKVSPFGFPGASKRILEIIDNMKLSELPRKKFIDRI